MNVPSTGNIKDMLIECISKDIKEVSSRESIYL